MWCPSLLILLLHLQNLKVIVKRDFIELPSPLHHVRILEICNLEEGFLLTMLQSDFRFLASRTVRNPLREFRME